MTNNKVLVVDDEAAIRHAFEKAFSSAGYTVHCTDSAGKALEVLEEENIQVMFLDLNLPEMTGLELCKRIRKDKPLAVIHAVTGYTSLFELVDCRDAGFDDYFTKPVELKVLLDAAKSAFERINRWKKQWGANEVE